VRTIATFQHLGGKFQQVMTRYSGAWNYAPDPRPLRLAGGATVRFAYLEVPSGAKIELVQR